MEIRDKVALVTGSAHRVGKSIGTRLAEEGANLAIHYHASASEAENTVEELRHHRIEIRSYTANLTQVDEIKRMFAAIEQDFGRLDILVNSAAVMRRKPFSQVTPAVWAETMDLNLRALFFCTQHAARLMGQHGGVVINISDIAGLQPWVNFPVHSISKAGVEMLTKVAALAYAPSIRVNAIAPGPVLKPDGMSDQRWQEIGDELPLRRPGRASDVAEAVVFLLKNEFVTGETLVVDGGNQLIT